MYLLLFLSFLLTIFYVSIMWTYKNEWEEIKEEHFLTEHPATSVSIIIPARNEAANIRHLIHDITHQVYPVGLLEVIIIDDYSEDGTYDICKQYSNEFSYIKVYKLLEIVPDNLQMKAYKKKAIEAAVQLAKGQLMITTDADCRLQQQGLLIFIGTQEVRVMKVYIVILVY